MNRTSYIFVWLIFSLAFSSCRFIGPGEQFDEQIGFSARQSDMLSTRAVFTDLDDLKDAGSFGAFAVKKDERTDYVGYTFDNREVWWNDTEWTYSPTKYWDRMCHYWFSCYAPYLSTASSATDPYLSSALTVSSDPVSYSYSVANIPQWQNISTASGDAAAFDLIVADTLGYAAAGKALAAGQDHSFEGSNGVVDLEFHHVLAKLTFQARVRLNLIAYGQKYYLDEISLGRASGDAAIPTDTYRTYTHRFHTGAESAFSTPTFASAVTYNVMTNAEGMTGDLYNDNASLLLSTSYAAKPFGVVLASPFEVPDGKNLCVTVRYHIYDDKGVREEEDKIRTVPVSGITKIESDHHYIISINFGATASIQVMAVDVDDWTQTEVSDEVYNW